VILLTNKIDWETQVERTLDLIQTRDDYNPKLSRDTLRQLVESLLTIEKATIDLRQAFYHLTRTDLGEEISKAAHKAIELTTSLFSPCFLLIEAIRNTRYELIETKGEEFDA
jgi:hypothetical protein